MPHGGAALGCDARRRGCEGRIRDHLQAMVSVLERGMGGDANKRHRNAQATAALCVGGMVVARAMDDRRLADELRDACMSVALKLGGWENGRTAKNGKQRMVGARS